MTITRYRKGQLSVPLLYTDEVDTLNGDLRLARLGVTNIMLVNAGNIMYHNPRLGTNRELQDIAANMLLGGDNVGNISKLARIDTPVTNPAGSQEVTLTPMELISPTQSGTLDEDEGFWYAGANDVLYLYLNTVLQFLRLMGTVHIESIKVNINTSAVTDFVTSLTVEWFNGETGISIDSVVDATDIGNGTTGNENGTITVNTALVTNAWYQLAIDAVVGASFVTVRSIVIKYRLT